MTAEPWRIVGDRAGAPPAAVEPEGGRWRDFAGLVGDLLFETDAAGRLSYVSEQSAELLGVAPRALQGRRLAELLAEPGDDPFAPPPVGGVPSAPRPFRVALRHACGTSRVFQISVMPMTMAGARWFAGWRGVARDITAREAGGEALVRAAVAAEAATRAKSDFLAHVDHELRTPLNAVMGFAQAIALNATGADRHREYAGDIVAAAADLLGKLEAILDAARMERGELELGDEPVALAPLLRRAAAAGAAGRAIETAVADDLPIVRGDGEHLERAVTALVGNAVKFGGPDARVALEAALLPTGGVEIVVSDNGPGIVSADLPHVFEPFWQRDSGIARTHAGIGLGLALADEIARRHDGRLLLDSEPGAGTRAILHLPAGRVVGAAVSRL